MCGERTDFNLKFRGKKMGISKNILEGIFSLSELTVYDKIKYHSGNDEQKKSSIERMKKIVSWLRKNNYLNDYGKEIVRDAGIDSDFRLTSDMLTDSGNVVMKKCFNKWISSVGYKSDISMDMMDRCSKTIQESGEVSKKNNPRIKKILRTLWMHYLYVDHYMTDYCYDYSKDRKKCDEDAGYIMGYLTRLIEKAQKEFFAAGYTYEDYETHPSAFDTGDFTPENIKSKCELVIKKYRKVAREKKYRGYIPH